MGLTRRRGRAEVLRALELELVDDALGVLISGDDEQPMYSVTSSASRRAPAIS